MCLMSFRGAGGHADWGVQRGEAVVRRALLGQEAPATLQALIEQAATPLEQITLLPLMPVPGKIICLGVNYHDHAKEGGKNVDPTGGFWPALVTAGELPPGGVGYARTPPVWMQAGETIAIDVERVGVLRNPVV